MVHHSLNKLELRQRFLKERQALSRFDWQQGSDRICDVLRCSTVFQSADVVLAYASFRHEPDISTLLGGPQRMGLPRCQRKSLYWHLWDEALALQPNAYGILEPHPDTPTIDVERVDLILVPAVACDRRGYRLGYGGGFYDRLLSSPEWSSKLTLGIVFDFARIAQLPNDPWDRPLDGVCTEAGLFWVEPVHQ